MILFSTFTYEQTCADTTPTNRYDCFKYSTNNERCCFKTGNKCSIETNLITFPEYDCGALGNNYDSYEFTPYKPKHQITGINFTPCGKAKVSKKESCTDYSLLMNSCCLFKANDQFGCFYLGKTYTGSNTKQEMNLEGKKVFFECSSSTFSFTMLSLFFSIIFIL